MKLLDTAEECRLELQKALDSRKTQQERNKLGQFATPSELANDILYFAKSLLPERGKIRFLDPAFGTGSFYSALLRVFSKSRIEEAVGYELDNHYADPTIRLWEDFSLEIRKGDFTIQDSPESEESKFDLLICNPPYVRHHYLDFSYKQMLQNAVAPIAGELPSGLMGLYCYFLLLSDRWMKRNGIACWLIPSEFMDVNYGRVIKHYLLDKVQIERIHRFDPSDVQFSDALVSSSVIVFRKKVPSKGAKILFSYGGTLNDPALVRDYDISLMKSKSKWSRFPKNDIVSTHEETKTLGQLFKIKRGLATGNNRFFILSMDQIMERKLPMRFFRPILPSPRHLHEDEINVDSKGRPILSRQLFLLDCKLTEEEIEKNHPTLWEYLEEGKASKVNEGYLCKSRKLWYLQEQRPASLFVCSYMGRSSEKGKNPFRFILNRSEATVANVYLLLYPQEPLKRILDKDPSMVLEVWNHLRMITSSELIEGGRVYGGGLHKLEPRELSNIPLNGLSKHLS